jgi:hypothetical protein
MPERTENEKAAASFDVQLTAVLKTARKRSDQLWPGVVGSLEMAQERLRNMMHPDDLAKLR